VSLRVDSRDI